MSSNPLKRPSVSHEPISPPSSKRKLTTTTTNKAIANFFKPASAKEPEKVRFQTQHDTLLVAHHNNAASQTRAKPVKIAAFDFDSTLISTKSGNKFAKGEDDWKWWHASVPARLKQLDAEGYLVVVLSNQGAVSLRSDAKVVNGLRSFNNLKGKVTAVFKALDLAMGFYAATGPDLFRKPRTGMWERMLRDYGLTAAEDVDLKGSVFVGDAAGREGDKVRGVKGDHSCSDRDVAANIGIRFQTPEEFFLGEEVKPFVRAIDPATYLGSEFTARTDTTPIVFTKKNNLDLVLFCGSPGAGKSTFYSQHMKPLGYERVNQDILKSREKCIKVATQYLEGSTSVVVDNTNADAEVRQVWISLAKKMGVPIRLVHFTASAKLCEHNDTVRALNGNLMNPEFRTMLPKIAFSTFASRYREPSVAEGFEDITRVDFQFQGTQEQREVWGRFWVS